MADLLTKEGSALPSAASNEHFGFEIFLLSTGQKQILLGESLLLTIGVMKTVLVCLYNPKVQDPHRQHWPDCIVVTSKA
ncbi:uncharacterized protein NPIL_135761 [Nephila pilipes]|uniref:Uncharacterized protein n=1 Tax=Nephila pilipes TaxID=299642 RepID=A0A8X6Q975_NEPPI|nr:uncharacterized protein NPIL_315421 [Nephila pilipes]GFU10623.1 uncharacterized protein NPIL_95001 [Nephila pilipes]GFU13383.1 uncharacterized protein NPIL_135761 [Nephila pilipes]